MRIDFEAHYYSQRFLEAIADREDIPSFDSRKQWMHHGGDGILPIKPILPRLVDMGEGRIRDMDEAGVDKAALSASIGVEQLPAEEGAAWARDANDVLAEAIDRYPDRLLGNCILAPKDRNAALAELERTAALGFVGWNAFSNYDGLMLDDPSFFPLLAAAERLGMYVYVHPTMPEGPQFQGYGPVMVTSGFGFALDVATCVVRMILAGVFDKLPGLKVIIGHSGEALPFLITRLDDANARLRGATDKQKNQKAPEEYFRTNIWMTTSGNFSQPAFFCAKDTFGIDHLLFGSDYPMESLVKGVNFIQSLDISSADTEKLFSGNAKTYFGIGR